MHLSAGVPAIVYRVPGLGAGVGAFARPGCTEVSLSSTTLDVLHVSLEVGEVKLGLAGHSIVASLPCPPIVGGCGVLDRDGLMHLSSWCSRNYPPHARSWLRV